MPGLTRFNGQTTNFSGVGSPNPQKLVIPGKNNMDPVMNTAMLALEQWCNNLVAPVTGPLFEFSQTYSVQGTLAVPSGASNYLPPFFMPVEPGTAITLTAVRYVCRAGTATIKIEQNGSTIASGLSVTTAPTSTAIGVGVSNDDYFAPVITAVSSSDGLSVSFEFTTNLDG